MIALMAALALAPAAAAAPAAAPPAAVEAPSPLADLQALYDQSCAAREYGAYDDLCDQLRRQIREAQVQAARDARRHPAKQPPPGR